MAIMYSDSPAEAFEAIEAVYMYAEDLIETVTVDGETMTIELDYRDPEGRQVDVDAFAPTWELEHYILEFGDELPDD